MSLAFTFLSLCKLKENDNDTENESTPTLTRDISFPSLQGKIIGLYFSAHWCPPCRGFTPVLKKRYLELKEQNFPFEIIFISSDSSEAEGLEYFSEMPWKMLDYKNKSVKNELSKLFEVSGIPSLILLDETGQLISKNGRSIVLSPPEGWKTYEADQIEAQRVLDEKIASLPDSVTHSSHSHPLIKTQNPYGRGRQYGCDICQGSGSNWAYHCPECNYDAHPACVCDL